MCQLEDLVEKSKKAVLRPFRLEECLKVAESQCDGGWSIGLPAICLISIESLC